MPGISEEVEKLKAIATNKQLGDWERQRATTTLAEVATREAVLALLDIANDPELHSWERDHALSRAREILKAKKI